MLPERFTEILYPKLRQTGVAMIILYLMFMVSLVLFLISDAFLSFVVAALITVVICPVFFVTFDLLYSTWKYLRGKD